MSIKLLHTADWHFQPGAILEETTRASRVVADMARERGVDLAVLAGDLFDRSLRLESPAAREAVDAIKNLAEAVPTLVIQGTPSHDVPGALDLLKKLSLPNLLVMEAAGVAVLDASGRLAPWPGDVESPAAVIVALPETTPTALASSGESPALALKEMIASLFEVGRRVADKTSAPLILAAHGLVRGAILPTGLPAPDDGLVLEHDDLSPADYVAMGHIHKPQEIANGAYSGSLVPQDFSETGPHGVMVVEVERIEKPRIDFVEVPCTPVATMDGAEIDGMDPEKIKGARIKVKLKIEEGVSPVEVEKPLREKLEEMGAAEVVFERRVEVRSRVRAEGISSRTSMWEKLQTWAEANGIDLHDTAKDDLAILESAETGDDAAARVLDTAVNGVFHEGNPKSVPMTDREIQGSLFAASA